MFEDVLPEYMAIGMTPEEFWHGDPSLCRAYRRAWEIRQDATYAAEWRQGVYTYQAIAVALEHALSKHAHSEYPQEPLFSSKRAAEERKKQRDLDLARRNAETFRLRADAINRRLRAEREATNGRGDDRQA